jgi:hypothetical protein
METKKYNKIYKLHRSSVWYMSVPQLVEHHIQNFLRNLLLPWLAHSVRCSVPRAPPSHRFRAVMLVGKDIVNALEAAVIELSVLVTREFDIDAVAQPLLLFIKNIF